MAKGFDAWKEISKIDKIGKEAALASGVASALPTALGKAYRENQDPKLDASINQAKGDMLGGAIQGMQRYQNISNPFDRMALADKYESSLSVNYSNLVAEKTRRQGVFQEYIQQWSGLFGAQAAMRQAEYSNAQNVYNMKNAQQKYEVEQEQKRQALARSGAGAKSSKYNARIESLAEDVRRGKIGRENARKILESEFPAEFKAAPNAMYNFVPDKYEETPYSRPYFTPKQEKEVGYTNPYREENDRSTFIKQLRDRYEAMGYTDEEIDDELRSRGY